MADKDKNDNVEYKKKMQKEENLEKEVVEMLIKEYGYSKNQIKTGHRISKIDHVLDVVVFTKESLKKKTPHIVIEIKNKLLLPLNEYQLEEIINATNASFGMLYDGFAKKLCYSKLPTSISGTTNKIVPIADIPTRKGFKRPKKVDVEQQQSAISMILNDLLENFREDYEHQHYLPCILAMKIVDTRNSTGYFNLLASDTYMSEEALTSYHLLKEEDDTHTGAMHKTIKKMISQTKDLFPFLQWDMLERDFEIIESDRRMFMQNQDYFESLPEKARQELIEQGKNATDANNKWTVPAYEDEDVDSWEGVSRTPLYYALEQLGTVVISNVMLEEAIHNALVKYTEDFPVQYKGQEGEFFTPDVLIEFSLQLLQPEKDKKLLIADSLASRLTIKHFLSKRFKLQKSSIDNYVKKTITTISNREPDSINQFEMMLPEFNLKVGDSMKVMEGLGMFDHVFSCGPFGMQLREQVYKKEFGNFGNDSENYRILNMLKHVNPGGKLALVLGSGFLFSISQKKIRNEIAKQCYVRAIIQLPEGTFNRYSGISTCLLILEKKLDKKPADLPGLYSSNYKIFMSLVPGKSAKTYHDLTTLNSSILKEVNLSFLQFQSFRNVRPDWYQDSLGFSVNYNDLGDKWTVKDKTPEMRMYEKIKNPQKLGDVVKSISSSTTNIDRINAETADRPGQEEIYILRIQDLEYGFVKSKIDKKIKIPRDAIGFISEEFLKDNDIIISNKATIGKTAIYKADNRLILPSPQVFVIKADTKKIYPEYLFKILNSKFIQNKLKSLATGAFIPRISKKDLEGITIPVPSQKEQRKIQEKYWQLKEEIKQLEKRVQEKQKKLMEFDI